MKYALTIPYEDDVLFSTGLSRDEFDEEAAFLLAAKLYDLGRLSSGQAALDSPYNGAGGGGGTAERAISEKDYGGRIHLSCL